MFDDLVKLTNQNLKYNFDLMRRKCYEKVIGTMFKNDLILLIMLKRSNFDFNNIKIYKLKYISKVFLFLQSKECISYSTLNFTYEHF
jgi:hypothetical protein